MKMKKIALISILSLGTILVVYFLFFHTTSLDDKLCNQIEKYGNKCSKIHFIDANYNLVFYENVSMLQYALIDDKLSKVEPTSSALNLNWIMVADDSLTWSGSISPPNGLPMIWGLATDNVKSIVITSENDIQPNKLKIQDNLWLWYAPINTDKLNMPIMMKAYDEKGNILYGEKF